MPFPWIGALAPVLAAALLFALTRSPLSLAFAALGPLMAVAALVDGRRGSRRTRRVETLRRADELSRLSVDIAERHDAVRRRLATTAPSARELIAADAPSTAATPGGPLLVRLGLGTVPSGLDLEPQTLSDRPIAESAARVTHAPVIVDARGGIGVVGERFLASVFARTVEVQLAAQGQAIDEASVSIASSLAALPARCGVVVEVCGPREARIIRGPGHEIGDSFEPEMLGAPEAASRRRTLQGTVPAHAELRGLLDARAAGVGDLSVAFAVAADGPLTIDLLADGPHALVGGTTGSGKSELLIAWMLALASAAPPERLELLLFDFKGGASFDRVTRLPHVRGLVTDLDGHGVDRAAASLGAEMRRREDTLRARRARSIDECDDLSRLVIVVDEFAALLGGRSDLHDVFADVAARGRSLGMHLILCTQRPTGVMRDSLLANCGLRISLRVVSAADSSAVIGIDAAARIPRSAPGRCFVTLHGDPPVEAQVASGDELILATIVDDLVASGRRGSARTPGFLPPLPARIPLRDAVRAAGDGATGVVLGRLDLPAEGRQPVALWDPARDGALVIAGAPGSGRSEAARTIARGLGAAVLRGGDATAVERFWDGLHDGEQPLVVDDLEAILDALSDDHMAALADMIPSALRARGRRVAVTVASPVAGAVRPMLAAFGSRLELRAASRDDHVLAGGGARDFDPDAPAGSGRWHGASIQVAIDDTHDLRVDGRGGPGDEGEPDEVGFRAGTLTCVVSVLPGRRVAQLATRQNLRVFDVRGAGAQSLADLDADTAHVVVGDPDGWQNAVHLWTALADADVVYDGCTVSQYRLVSRRRTVPPPLADLEGRVWLSRPEQPARRAMVDWTQDTIAGVTT